MWIDGKRDIVYDDWEIGDGNKIVSNITREDKIRMEIEELHTELEQVKKQQDKLANSSCFLKRQLKEIKADRRFLSILLRDAKHDMLMNLDPELAKAIIRWAGEK